MHVRAVVAASALLATALLVAPASSALCADTSAYAPIATQASACESATGVKLTPPLTSVQTKSVCKSCASLAASTKAKSLPNCTLAGGSTLQSLYDSIFVCSSVLDSSAGSGDAGGVTPTPTPKTVTPTPTPTTATPATPTPTPAVTPKPSTDAPTTTAPSPSPTGGAGSGSSGTPRPTTKSPAATTKAPTTSAAPSSDPSSNSPTDSSGSQNQTAGKKDGTDEDKIAVTIGIAGGVIVFVVIVAALIVCRHRRRNRDDKLEDELLSPSTRALTPGYAPSPARQSTAPARGSMTPGTAQNSAPTHAAYGGQRGSVPRYSGGGHSGPRYSAGAAAGSSSGGGRSSGSSQYVPQGGLWDDEVIVAARVPREKVLSETLLSRGGFGEVYRGTYNGQVVAIKTLLPEAKKSLKQINAFLSEIRLMATLEHERIVTFIGVAWDSLNDLCVVTEYMEGGDLRATLTRFEDVERRRHGFDHDKIRIATHIAHALTYLHSLRPVVLHRDLKSKNILLDRQLNAKLTDFGVSRERSDTTTMTAGVGTSLWMAPEVMLGERYDEKSDIFSFGVVLSELDSHALPYAHAKAVSSDSGHRLPDTAILQLVSLGRLSVQFSPHANPAVVALARACVAVNPVERPTAADVLYRLHSLRKHY